MARGITESVVHEAADSVVGAGERPTVERIRSHLGTGSPNTIVRWLDTWWTALPDRLNAHKASLNVASAPEMVHQLAGQWWALALEHARQEVAVERQLQLADLDVARSALAEERVQQEAIVNAAKLQADEAVQRERLSLAQVSEMRGLIAQLENRSDRAEEELGVARSQLINADTALRLLQSERERILEEAKHENSILLQHLRAVEDRSQTEIDRARQESRSMSADLRHLRKQVAIERQTLERGLIEAKQELRVAMADSASHKARAAELEGKLLALHDLPTVLNSAIQQLQKQATSGTSQTITGRVDTPRKRTKKKGAPHI